MNGVACRRGTVPIEVVMVAAVMVPLSIMLFLLILRAAPFLYSLVSGFVNSPYL